MLVIVACVNYGFALLVGTEKNALIKKLWMIASVIFNCLYLGFFKYTYTVLSYLIGTIKPELAAATSVNAIMEITTIVPIGISYYTFKSMSYVFDVYLNKMNYRHSLGDVLLYVSFFPQLLSGPIVRAHKFFDDFEASLTRDRDNYPYPIAADRASILLISGLFKKTVIANILSLLVTDRVLATPAMFNTWEILFAIVSYTMVIYCDFSGYSDMAIGIGLLLGFDCDRNFNRPYISGSVTEFWKRWHISFSSWLRDYVFFAFGGSRYGLARAMLALIATMLIGGLWHGLKTTFLVWGLMQGVALAIERILDKRNEERFEQQMQEDLDRHFSGEWSEKSVGQMMSYSEFQSAKKRKSSGLAKLGRMFLVFVFVNISWLIFQAESMADVLSVLSSLKNIGLEFQIITPFLIVVLVVSMLMQIPDNELRGDVFRLYSALPIIVKVIFVGTCFLAIKLLSTSGIAPFIYFQF